MELKPCPFCGIMPARLHGKSEGMVCCVDPSMKCVMAGRHVGWDAWNSRAQQEAVAYKVRCLVPLTFGHAREWFVLAADVDGYRTPEYELTPLAAIKEGAE